MGRRSAFIKVVSSALSGAMLFAGSASAFASDWDIDSSHSHVGFGVRHMMVSTVHGTFDKYSGSIAVDDGDISKAKMHVEIDASSIDTANPKRDEHLRSPDFFDTAHFPKIVFDSTKVEKRGGIL